MQYDVHRNADPATNPHIPYFIDVQADCLERFITRVVIPLMRESEFGPRIPQLNPAFVVEGQTFILATGDIASVLRHELGDTVASFVERRYDIINATDFLLTGI